MVGGTCGGTSHGSLDRHEGEFQRRHFPPGLGLELCKEGRSAALFCANVSSRN